MTKSRFFYLTYSGSSYIFAFQMEREMYEKLLAEKDQRIAILERQVQLQDKLIEQIQKKIIIGTTQNY